MKTIDVEGIGAYRYAFRDLGIELLIFMQIIQIVIDDGPDKTRIRAERFLHIRSARAGCERRSIIETEEAKK